MLAGTGTPFQRLSQILADRQYSAAAIDAPFSLPASYMPKKGWRKLLELVDALPLDGNAPFPSGPALIALARKVADLESLKPLRQTERFWVDRKLNVRSTLWWKPRGGAPFAAACMKLLASAGSPKCWPWSAQSDGIVAEAFPAAQLLTWKLPFKGYEGPGGLVVRRQIIGGLKARVDFGAYKKTAEESADALDAVIASFGAIAASRSQAPLPADRTFLAKEGWIAIHS
jgi:hypothetical protein